MTTPILNILCSDDTKTGFEILKKIDTMEKIPDIIHESWHELLQPLFDDPKMAIIKNTLLPNCKFYPEAKNIFRVFEMPISDIKVVVLGQDPYFNDEME